MYVVKRNGQKEEVHMDKVTNRVRKLAYNLDPQYCDPVLIALKTVKGIYSGVTTEQLDELAAETCAYMSTVHPDYSKLGARIFMSNLHKKTLKSFSETMKSLSDYLSPEFLTLVETYAEKLDPILIHDRDMEYDYFAAKTLEKSYLLRKKGKVVERPQHMLMRVALAIHCDDTENVVKTYELMSKRMYTQATPTLYNAGTKNQQLSSCFLLSMREDSIGGIYDTLKQTALISKQAGGMSLSVHDIRAKGSEIISTNGISNGIVPMLRVFDASARYVDQGGGKRKGSIAIYIEPWHADVEDFLDLKKNNGKEEYRARDLFYALWIPDLFMKRVEAGGDWTLMCPRSCPGLSDVWGAEFDNLYQSYEEQGLGLKTVKAQELWSKMVASQIETGMPYVMFKDACNAKSNQQNLGTIKQSNLCTEIVQYASKEEVAVCNLASINLTSFVVDRTTYDYDGLCELSAYIVKNMNKVIDCNVYPVPEAEYSNKKNRPIGLGVQGLADVFMMMKLPFDSVAASKLNRNIFETIYYGACRASMELSKVDGPYDSFAGSPISFGKFQFDLWGADPNPELQFDWDGLRELIIKHGIRNSLLISPMPTASTSQILGNNECFEPYTSNLFSRRVLAGDFMVINKHLVKDLVEMKLWGSDMCAKIISYRGSVQDIPEIPDDLKAIYKTVWEIKQRTVIDMAADRGPFIDQSQSMNLFIAEPTVSKMSSALFHSWKKGLKTGMYYLRGKPKADPIQFTVVKEKDYEDCETCGS